MKTITPASLVLILLLSSCGSSGDSSSDAEVVAVPGASETTDAGGESSSSEPTEPENSTTTTTLIPAGNTLAGEWRAKAEDILAANLANLGGLPMACTGDVVMYLNADGSFGREGSMACSIDEVEVLGQVVNSSGKWEATSDTITVTITKNDGYAESLGPSGKSMRMPLPDSGFSSADYEVTATILTITFTEPSVGTVTQVYTRG